MKPGYELIKAGELTPEGTLCRGKNDLTGPWSSTVATGHLVEDRDLNWYIRPVPQAAPSEMRCPFCNSTLECGGISSRCRNPSCDLFGVWLRDALWKRIRIEPESMMCPKCNFSVETKSNSSGHQSICCNCGVSGPAMDTVFEAEAEFKKLDYQGE